LDRKIDTAHEPDPTLQDIQGELPGCGAPAKTAEEIQAELIMQVKKSKESLLKGYEKKEPTVEELRLRDEFNRLHPYGEYREADYHKQDKKNDKKKTDEKPLKSPAPKDGQKALDNSYGLQGYEHRAAIEDGKYVILYKEEEGIYHGFVCDKWKNVPEKIQSIFQEYKLVHPKSGEILKR